MARETKEIFCIRLGDHYDVVDYYKMFDWKLERYEKYKDWIGEAERSPKVTFFDFFSRDKDTPWYNRVCALE